MKKTITIGIAILTLFTLVSAYYPGETIIVEHNLGTDNLIYTIIDNSSELIVLPNVTINSTHIQIYFPTNMPPNSFTIVFLEEQTEEVIIEVHHYSSGGGSTKKVYIENKTIEYVNKTILCNQTEVINLTPEEITIEDLTIEEKNWLGKFWVWIKKLFGN